MARVNYEGVPDVAATTEAPNDLEHIEANPRAFGEGIAQGGEALGQGLKQASMFYGQVAADNATNNTLQQVTNELYGDPNKISVGPDGQKVSDGGYFGLRGADAMRARSEVSQRIDEIIKDNSQGLETPLAQHQYDNDTRRYRARWLSDIGQHADQQQRTWSMDTNNTSATLALNDLARFPGDDNIVAGARDIVRKSFVRNAQLNGEDAGGAVLKADQQVAKMQVESLLATDPIAAQRAMSANRGALASMPDYDYLSYRVQEKALGIRAQALSNILLGQPPGIAIPGAGHPDIKSAILGQESGGNPNAPTSVSGAVGPGQMKPGTFAQFAKPGENINTSADNIAVSGRAIDAYSQKYNGDAARVAVAYFSGPGNVAPAGSPTPWKRDAKDPTGKSTSSYVSDVMGRLGGSQSATDALLGDLPPDQRQDVVGRAMADMHRRVLEAKELHAVTDDPGTTVTMWHQVDMGQISQDNIIGAVRAGQITTATGTEMMKAVDNGPRRTGTEKDAFSILKTALNGGAIENGQFSIFPGEEKARAATNWAEAQGEWSRRIGQGEQPLSALNEMIPRYAPQTRSPTWLIPPRFATTPNIQTIQDVNTAAVATLRARQANQITQQDYESQVNLLNQYRRFYMLEDQAQKARQAALKTKPKTNGGVTVTPDEGQ